MIHIQPKDKPVCVENVNMLISLLEMSGFNLREGLHHLDNIVNYHILLLGDITKVPASILYYCGLHFVDKDYYVDNNS